MTVKSHGGHHHPGKARTDVSITATTRQFEGTGEWYATCKEYPSLSWFADTAQEAIEGLLVMVDDIEAGRA